MVGEKYVVLVHLVEVRVQDEGGLRCAAEIVECLLDSELPRSFLSLSLPSPKPVFVIAAVPFPLIARVAMALGCSELDHNNCSSCDRYSGH